MLVSGKYIGYILVRVSSGEDFISRKFFSSNEGNSIFFEPLGKRIKKDTLSMLEKYMEQRENNKYLKE